MLREYFTSSASKSARLAGNLSRTPVSRILKSTPAGHRRGDLNAKIFPPPPPPLRTSRSGSPNSSPPARPPNALTSTHSSRTAPPSRRSSSAKPPSVPSFATARSSLGALSSSGTRSPPIRPRRTTRPNLRMLSASWQRARVSLRELLGGTCVENLMVGWCDSLPSGRGGSAQQRQTTNVPRVACSPHEGHGRARQGHGGQRRRSDGAPRQCGSTRRVHHPRYASHSVRTQLTRH